MKEKPPSHPANKDQSWDYSGTFLSSESRHFYSMLFLPLERPVGLLPSGVLEEAERGGLLFPC